MKRTILKQLAFIVGGYLMVFNANANNNDLNGWRTQGLTNVTLDPSTNVVSFSKAESVFPWDCQFIPPTWIAPSKGKSEAFELSFDARYVGNGTDGDGTGHIQFAQGRQFGGYPGDDATIQALCESLGIEIMTVGDRWKIQKNVEQMIVSGFTGSPDNFVEGNLYHNVNFYPTSEWQHFSFWGVLGRHAADSIDLEWDFGVPAGTYEIANVLFTVKNYVFAEYFTPSNQAIVDDIIYDVVNNQARVRTLTNPDIVELNIPSTIIYGGIEIPVTSISDYVFAYAKLSTVILPNSVTKIGKSAFKDCTSLESIYIPDSVEEIGENAFSGCKSLRSIRIPDSVKIGEYAFFDCSCLPDKIKNFIWRKQH